MQRRTSQSETQEIFREIFDLYREPGTRIMLERHPRRKDCRGDDGEVDWTRFDHQRDRLHTPVRVDVLTLDFDIEHDRLGDVQPMVTWARARGCKVIVEPTSSNCHVHVKTPDRATKSALRDEAARRFGKVMIKDHRNGCSVPGTAGKLVRVEWEENTGETRIERKLPTPEELVGDDRVAYNMLQFTKEKDESAEWCFLNHMRCRKPGDPSLPREIREELWKRLGRVFRAPEGVNYGHDVAVPVMKKQVRIYARKRAALYEKVGSRLGIMTALRDFFAEPSSWTEEDRQAELAMRPCVESEAPQPIIVREQMVVVEQKVVAPPEPVEVPTRIVNLMSMEVKPGSRNEHLLNVCIQFLREGFSEQRIKDEVASRLGCGFDGLDGLEREHMSDGSLRARDRAWGMKRLDYILAGAVKRVDRYRVLLKERVAHLALQHIPRGPQLAALLTLCSMAGVPGRGYRNLMRTTGYSIGTISGAVNWLVEHGWLQRRDPIRGLGSREAQEFDVLVPEGLEHDKRYRDNSPSTVLEAVREAKLYKISLSCPLHEDGALQVLDLLVSGIPMEMIVHALSEEVRLREKERVQTLERLHEQEIKEHNQILDKVAQIKKSAEIKAWKEAQMRRAA